MNQAIENSEVSISLAQTTEGALTEINRVLVNMRQLAVHASNVGVNDPQMMEADQAELRNSIEMIERVAKDTQFGTKALLDGSKGLMELPQEMGSTLWLPERIQKFSDSRV